MRNSQAPRAGWVWTRDERGSPMVVTMVHAGEILILPPFWEEAGDPPQEASTATVAHEEHKNSARADGLIFSLL